MATAAPGFQDEEFELDGMGRILVQANSKPPFNVATFLASVDGGRTVSRIERIKGSSCRGIRRILSFTFRKAWSRCTLFPRRGRKRSSRLPRRQSFTSAVTARYRAIHAHLSSSGGPR